MEEKEVPYITPELPSPPVYFKSLTIENVKCFQGEHFIDLSNGKGGPAQWTVILGNNNTGKTTLLKCLAGLTNEESFDPPEGRNVFSPRIAPFLPSLINTYKHPNIISIKSEVAFFKDFIYSINIFRDEKSVEKATVADWEITDLYKISEYAIQIATAKKTSKNFKNLLVYSFGTSRRFSAFNNAEPLNKDLEHNIFENNDLPNPESWLLGLFLANQLGQEQAQNILNLAKKVLVSGILPDVSGIEFKSETKGSGFENFVLFKTDYGPIRLHELGYGYQTMIAWILDLVRRMVERYPNSRNPLAEPAIVLVDEIDLHLHPDWQRKIIAHLTKHFPNTQFIVTAHSPLIVQSAEELNLVILKKENDRVVVDQPRIRSFKGWTVEEIMTDLMQMKDQTMSNTYLDLMAQFDKALDEDNYEKAHSAFDQLAMILHEESSQLILLKLQMSALSQPNVV